MSMLKTALTPYKNLNGLQSDSSVYVNVADLLSTLRKGGKEYSKNYYGGSIVLVTHQFEIKTRYFTNQNRIYHPTRLRHTIHSAVVTFFPVI